MDAIEVSASYKKQEEKLTSRISINSEGLR